MNISSTLSTKEKLFQDAQFQKSLREYEQGNYVDHAVVLINGYDDVTFDKIGNKQAIQLLQQFICNHLRSLSPAPNEINISDKCVECKWHFPIPIHLDQLPDGGIKHLEENLKWFVSSGRMFVVEDAWLSTVTDASNDYDKEYFMNTVYLPSQLHQMLGIEVQAPVL